MPRNVLQEAARLGVHADCVASERPCNICTPLIMQSFDRFYSHCETTHELIVAIMEDFHNDVREES